MKVTEIYNSLVEQGKKGFSIEILPPVKGTPISHIEKSVSSILPLGPQFINITFHAPIRKLIQEDSVSTVVSSHARTATSAVAGALKRRTGIEVVPHLVCAQYSKLQLEDFIIDFSYEDLENVFVVRADKDPLDSKFRANPYGHNHAAGLVEQINDVRHGIYHDRFVKNPTPIDFCIGVAGYPEAHEEANSLYSDISFLKQKVDAGADYVVTQMFFDNEEFYKFVSLCRTLGIKVPIIPALKPISLFSHLESLPKTFKVSIPDDLRARVLAVRDNDQAVKEVGMQWLKQQTKDLLAHGYPIVHYFTMGRLDYLAVSLKDIFV